MYVVKSCSDREKQDVGYTGKLTDSGQLSRVPIWPQLMSVCAKRICLSEGVSEPGGAVGKGEHAAERWRRSSEEVKVSSCPGSAELQEKRWLLAGARHFQALEGNTEQVVDPLCC